MLLGEIREELVVFTLSLMTACGCVVSGSIQWSACTHVTMSAAPSGCLVLPAHAET
ncbi:MAG TPA: hypothetical protein VM925_24840 [Labilithrix sp.]|nr:hypothetical protein [Labilithrix sp.]